MYNIPKLTERPLGRQWWYRSAKGTFSSQDGNAKERDVNLRMNLYFSLNVANGWKCLQSSKAPHLNLSITYMSGVEFQVETETNLRWVFPFSDHAYFGDFTLPFFRIWLRNAKSYETHYPCYFSADLLSCHFLVTFAVLVCVKSLTSVWETYLASTNRNLSCLQWVQLRSVVAWVSIPC